MTDPAEDTPNSPARAFVIVFGYAEGVLGSGWHRAYRKAKQTIKRGSFNALVVLAPANALPPVVDLLVLPPSLADALVPGSDIRDVLSAAPDRLQQAFDQRIAEHIEAGRLERAPAPAKALAIHRGFRAVGERAGIAG